MTTTSSEIAHNSAHCGCIDPTLLSQNAEVHRKDFARTQDGYIFVSNAFRKEVADTLAHELTCTSAWGLKLCMGEQIRGLPPAQYLAASQRDLNDIAADCHRSARQGFAFLREEISTEWRNETADAAKILQRARATVGSHAFLNLCAHIVGVGALQLIETCCVRYSPGNFYGFTMGAPARAEIGFLWDLTASWELEWGGLLEFLDFTGGIQRAYLPRFNGLWLHYLSKHHGISYVTAFARDSRYVISGKLQVMGK